MLMERIIIYGTFLPWLLHYALLICNAIKSTKDTKLDKKWFKKNIGRIFYVEDLLLVAIFIYFSTYHNNTVNEMLFAVINLYLFVHTFYDRRAVTHSHVEISDVSSILLVIILSFFPIIYYVKTNQLLNMYFILFGYAFASFLIVLLSRAIDSLLKKLLKK